MNKIRNKCSIIGGPYDGKKIKSTTMATLKFTAAGFKGFYRRQLDTYVWVEL